MKKVTLQSIERRLSALECILRNFIEERKTAISKSQCKHKYIHLTIERDDGWLRSDVVCTECNKHFPRNNNGGYIGWWGRWMIKRVYKL